jgi:hypothetical protein
MVQPKGEGANMSFKYTVGGNTVEELRAAFEELFGESAPAKTTRAPRGSKKDAPEPIQVPPATATEQPTTNVFNPPVTAAGGTAAPDVFNPPPAANPFQGAAPTGSPAVEQLISNIVTKIPIIGTGPALTYLVKSLSLSPSITLDEIYALLRAGKIPPEVVDDLVKQTAGPV